MENPPADRTGVAGFKSERVAGFASESLADFASEWVAGFHRNPHSRLWAVLRRRNSAFQHDHDGAPVARIKFEEGRASSFDVAVRPGLHGQAQCDGGGMVIAADEGQSLGQTLYGGTIDHGFRHVAVSTSRGGSVVIHHGSRVGNVTRPGTAGLRGAAAAPALRIWVSSTALGWFMSVFPGRRRRA